MKKLILLALINVALASACSTQKYHWVHAEKDAQLASLRAFQARHAERAPAALGKLQAVARSGGNIFEELMQTVKVASLQQISDALFEAGGRYRRAM